MNDQPSKGKDVEGRVAARPCGCCGHHEIGIVTAAGDYIPLRPGIQVKIIGGADQHADNVSA